MENGDFSASAYEHIERIRRETFYIGREEKNPLAQMVHRTVGYLSEELYSKDVHFLMELIQNAEDNVYPDGIAPSLEFVITSKDITETGAASTLCVFNNERGFSLANIESICGAGMSTKKGNRHRGYIGEKGIGFKSVFLISSQPHIFSNGYQIRFNEEPCPECNIGYIVPEWVDANPMLCYIKQVYGSSKPLPTTTLILPLKTDKVQAVKQQLSKMHPEILLFLSKIKQLSVREDNDSPKLSTVSQISITGETDAQMRKNIDAESYTRDLSAQENGKSEGDTCSYYMWKQKFPVKSGCRVEKRMEVDEWMITLAFPWNQRLNRGLTMPGVYAFLPTEMVTTFPFIIQADFLLSSSRESILMDSPWNKGILECVPSAFVNAFLSLVKSTDFTPSFSIPPMFRFLPINSSSVPLLDSVRLSIKEKVTAEHIIPCESQTDQKIFCRPNEVGRLMPAFWDILYKAQKLGVDLKNLSSHGMYVLSSSFDKGEYDKVLNFLGVGFVEKKWYGKCIESANLIKEVSELVYLDLLSFLADNWENGFASTSIVNMPLLKYVDENGSLSFWSIYKATQWSYTICISSDENSISWLIDWNGEFRSANLIFMPKCTQTALKSHSKYSKIVSWLRNHAMMKVLTVYDYARLILGALGSDRKLVIAFTHFMYHSLSNNYLDDYYVKQFCNSMPLVDNYGCVTAQRKEVLVPAKGSKWVGLMGSNPWRSENYVELGADYMSSGYFAGNRTSGGQLLVFLRGHINASDVPEICPPNASFPTVSSPLTKENAILLLEWIRNLRYRGIQIPKRFLDCVRLGSWVKTCVGYKPPSESFLSSSDWGSLLQMESVLVDIPMINQGFYDYKLGNYKDELRLIGVRFEFGEASTYIGNHLMTTAATSSLTRANVISLLKLIRVLGEKKLSPGHLISSIQNASWLKTSHGYRSPVGSVLSNTEWSRASCISNLPFIDTCFYCDEIINYGPELSLLGVLVSFNHNYRLLVDHFKLTSPVSADAAILILDCIRYVTPCENFVSKLRGLRWVKTHLGYKTPVESFLVDSEWECLLQVVNEVPLIDQGFYEGRLVSYKEELKKAGVIVRFEEASKAIAHQFKLISSSSSFTKKNVIALLSCYRQLKKMHYSFPVDLTNCMHGEKWLRTQMGFKSPSELILFDPLWKAISSIATLPLIDDTDAYYGKEIYEYRDELKALGAIVEFKDGAHFVVNGLKIPKDVTAITPASVLSLLKCIRNLKAQKMCNFPKEFMRSINKKWLKTVLGYKCPTECTLYDSKFESFLQMGDGPFIDESFYGLEITTYKEELLEIGVIVECGFGCSLLADHLKCHSQSDIIARIYKYLMQFKWKPENDDYDWIWIPKGSEGGKWVGSESCVIHDKDNLFGSQLHVLDKCYEHDMLGFFSMVFKVKSGPTVEDYCKLWNMWETAITPPTEAECSAYWIFIAKHWSTKSEKLLKGGITRLPVLTGNGISLSNKQDVFIPDDLLLKDLFDKASDESIFIWYPSTNHPSTSRAKMNKIFSAIGVQTISESTQKDQFSLTQHPEFKILDSKEAMIKVGLLKIILGFLADPSLDLSVEYRQNIVKCLLDSTVLESVVPITMSYSLTLSSGKTLKVDASRIIRWERENSNLFIQKIDRSCGQRADIEFATYFSEVISEGLLFEKADQINALTELIKVGCLVEFDDAAVEFLLKSKNLQLFAEDEEFLLSAFSSLNI